MVSQTYELNINNNNLKDIMCLIFSPSAHGKEIKVKVEEGA